MKRLKDLGFENAVELEQFLEKLLLNKRKSLNDIIETIKKELKIDDFHLQSTTWDETIGIDKSFIGGLSLEDDWYILDIEIYYLETYTYNINGEKNIFITEISVIENYKKGELKMKKTTELYNVIDEYIEKYKKEVLKTIEEFGYTVDLEKIKTMAQNRKNKIINAFDYGIDVSQGLISQVEKPVDIIKKENNFYFVVILKKKEYLYDFKYLFR